MGGVAGVETWAWECAALSVRFADVI